MDNRQIQRIQRILRTFHLDASGETASSLLQFIRFGIVGVSNTLVSYALNVLVLFLMRPLEADWDFIAGTS